MSNLNKSKGSNAHRFRIERDKIIDYSAEKREIAGFCCIIYID